MGPAATLFLHALLSLLSTSLGNSLQPVAILAILQLPLQLFLFDLLLQDGDDAHRGSPKVARYLTATAVFVLLQVSRASAYWRVGGASAAVEWAAGGG